MAIVSSYDVTTYKLRAGAPMPTKNSGDFVVHTFKAQKSRIEVFQCTDTLPSSSDFRGQGGSLMSANFSRVGVEGGDIFKGKKMYNPIFIEEEDMGS